jgi:hypothetical protein
MASGGGNLVVLFTLIEGGTVTAAAPAGLAGHDGHRGPPRQARIGLVTWSPAATPQWG